MTNLNNIAAGSTGNIRRVLLTGAAGFIGSHLTDRLLSLGCSVEAMDNLITGRIENLSDAFAFAEASAGGEGESDPGGAPGNIGFATKFEFVQADVSVPFEPRQAPDLILHFACPASPKDYMAHPIETMLVDSYGTHNTLEIARKYGARFMIASTSEVYGDPEVHPQPESYWGNVNPIGPRSVYDEAKRFSEALTFAYARQHGVDVRVARIFNTFGPRMRIDDGRVVPAFVGQAVAGEPLTIFGDGTQTRTFSYIEDTMEALLRFAFHDELAGEVINIGGIEERTILNFAQEVLRIFDSKSEVQFVEAAVDDPQRRKPDISKAQRLLDWTPGVSLEEGLKLTAENLS